MSNGYHVPAIDITTFIAAGYSSLDSWLFLSSQVKTSSQVKQAHEMD